MHAEKNVYIIQQQKKFSKENLATTIIRVVKPQKKPWWGHCTVGVLKGDITCSCFGAAYCTNGTYVYRIKTINFWFQ